MLKKRYSEEFRQILYKKIRQGLPLWQLYYEYGTRLRKLY